MKGVIAAKRPGLLANLHPPFSVVAATVFAGKPAPTPDWGWTHIGDWAQALTAEFCAGQDRRCRCGA
ncbi:hypothetical protein C4Q27_24915 [Pseudomonas sp. SWI36]|nr:hypothetical protein C4Q27_24915 [Pseudomonas sp. SWI36]